MGFVSGFQASTEGSNQAGDDPFPPRLQLAQTQLHARADQLYNSQRIGSVPLYLVQGFGGTLGSELALIISTPPMNNVSGAQYWAPSGSVDSSLMQAGPLQSTYGASVGYPGNSASFSQAATDHNAPQTHVSERALAFPTADNLTRADQGQGEFLCACGGLSNRSGQSVSREPALTFSGHHDQPDVGSFQCQLTPRAELSSPSGLMSTWQGAQASTYTSPYANTYSGNTSVSSTSTSVASNHGRPGALLPI